jgi:hypothetical protein
MIWAILALLGVPLWLCAVGITIIVFRNRGLRKRYGDIPVRVKRPGKTRWTRGHAVWVSDVFAWRGSPAAWSEDIVQVTGVRLRSPDEEERHKLRRLGDGVQIATLSSLDGEPLEVATWPEDRTALVGPFLGTNLEKSTNASVTGRAEPTTV